MPIECEAGDSIIRLACKGSNDCILFKNAEREGVSTVTIEEMEIANCPAKDIAKLN